jgi:iron complex outermembrane recepter protein
MLMRFYFFILFIATALAGQAQCTLRYSGTVTDADTKEPLHKATIQIKELSINVTTNAQGIFTIEGLCPGHYDVVISHVGCKTINTHIHIKDDYSTQYVLPHAAEALTQVTVTAFGKTPANGEVNGKALDAVKGLALGEALKKITGVSILQTGTNIYKPVIHGLHSNRVLILNNGIRLEGQQWGNEHAPEVDPYIANRIAVIKGAATMRYGGDAIGGIVLVEPKLLRALPGIGGEINSAFFGNSRMGVLSVIIEGNAKKIPAFSWRLQGTYKRGGNAKTPKYWLDNSGTRENNFSATAGWRKTNFNTELFYSQFNTQLGIFSGSHIGNVTDLLNTINAGTPPSYITSAGFSYKIDRPYQQVQHHLLKSKTFFNTGKIGRLNIIASFQYNNRKEYDKKRFQSSEDVPQLDLSIATVGTDVVWDHFTWKKLRGTIGITGNYQRNDYSRRLFIPNYKSINTGIFLIEKWERKKWILEGGVRYDYRNFYNTTDNNGGSYASKNYYNTSGNLSATYKISSQLKLNASLSSAWRAPSINELYSDGLHHGAARLEKGNAALVPERANSITTAIHFTNEKWDIEAAFYTKQINNFIFLEPTFPPQLTIRGAFPSFKFNQTDASFSGVDASAAFQMSHHLKWIGKISLLRAYNKTANTWLIQMPADRLENELEYTFNNGKFFKESYAKLSIQNILRQTRVPAAGTIEITRPDGSKYYTSDYSPAPNAYMLLGVEAGTDIAVAKKSMTIVLSATNLLNTVYRDYMNAFRYYADDMGRNIALRLKIPFELKQNNK